MLQGMGARIEQLEKENASWIAHAKQSVKERDERIEALRKENENLSHKLAVANETREKDRQQINGLYEKVKTYRETYDSMNKNLCEKAHKILVLEAETADLSRKLRDAQALLGLVPDDALTIAKLTQLASMGK